jgi:hypothetical protein
MQITRDPGDTTRGPGEGFTGKIYVDIVAAPSAPSRLWAHRVQ